MTKEKIIKRSLESLNKLPLDKIQAVSDYIDFMISKYADDNQSLQSELYALVQNSEAFDFLEEEEDLYDENDLIVKY